METKDNIYLFKLNESVIKPIVEKKVKKGDLLGALSLLRSSLRHEFSLEVVGDIAELYSEMEQYELSNKWWFYYLSQAPKEKKGRAFEELALNFYCLENEVLITHYLVEKYNLDGNISNDVLTSGIDELLKESAQQPKFRLLHPVELADYSYELKKAKSYMSLGCYTKAIDLLESIPKGCKQYLPSLEEKWLAYYLKGETKKSVAIIKEVIAEKGESLLTCCHLSGMYKTLNQEEKSLYYYEKAKQMPSTDAEDVYRLAYVAFEREDGVFACECMEKILKERRYDVNMLYFYGLALINCGKYQKAEKILKRAYRINPQESSLGFYVNLAENLKKGDKESKKYLPLKYFLEVPEIEFKKRIEAIDVLCKNNRKKIKAFVKKEENHYLLEWGLFSKNDNLVETITYALLQSETEIGDELLSRALINNDIQDGIKRAVIYNFCYRQKLKRIHFVLSNHYFSVKPKKFNLPKDDEVADLFLATYSLCFSTLAMFKIDGGSKLVEVVKDIYNKLNACTEIEKITREELSAVVCYESKLAPFNDLLSVSLCFDCEKERVEKIYRIYKGENND